MTPPVHTSALPEALRRSPVYHKPMEQAETLAVAQHEHIVSSSAPVLHGCVVVRGLLRTFEPWEPRHIDEGPPTLLAGNRA
jgi:hypothetical protein